MIIRYTLIGFEYTFLPSVALARGEIFFFTELPKTVWLTSNSDDSNMLNFHAQFLALPRQAYTYHQALFPMDHAFFRTH